MVFIMSVKTQSHHCLSFPGLCRKLTTLTCAAAFPTRQQEAGGWDFFPDIICVHLSHTPLSVWQGDQAEVLGYVQCHLHFLVTQSPESHPAIWQPGQWCVLIVRALPTDEIITISSASVYLPIAQATVNSCVYFSSRIHLQLKYCMISRCSLL